MKRFWVKIIVFGLCMLAVDFAVGNIVPWLMAHAKGGDTWRNTYICDRTSEDILVFGSSRALHHYNPQIISDSLGMTCYNCGQNANGIILNYGCYELICQRYAPKYVIYDVFPNFDVLTDDNHKYLRWLKEYFDRDGIPELFQSVDPTERFKMMSNLYRFNSYFIRNFIDWVYPLSEPETIGGCLPLYGEMDESAVYTDDFQQNVKYDFDSLKLSYLEKFVRRSPQTRVIFVLSPKLNGIDPRSWQPVREMATEYGIPLIDFSNDPKYIASPEYFDEWTHLNKRGADEFTRDLTLALRTVIAK